MFLPSHGGSGEKSIFPEGECCSRQNTRQPLSEASLSLMGDWWVQIWPATMYLAMCQEITLRVWGWHSERQRWESEKEREKKGRKKENPVSYHRLLFQLASTFPWLGYINQEVSHFGISKIPAEFKSLAAPRILIHTGNMLFAPKMKSLIVSMYFQLKTEYFFFQTTLLRSVWQKAVR